MSTVFRRVARRVRGVEIRPMGAEEIAAAADVWWQSMVDSTPWLRCDQRHSKRDSLAFFRARYATDSHDTWVAVRDGAIVGFMAITANELERLYVATAAQRDGVGTALLDHAKARRPDGIRLVTLQRNLSARRFYERHGFVAYETGVSPPPETEPDVWYRWPA
jgi:ribosomal protein S18 acetylase RimI-like enzyme